MVSTDKSLFAARVVHDIINDKSLAEDEKKAEVALALKETGVKSLADIREGLSLTGASGYGSDLLSSAVSGATFQMGDELAGLIGGKDVRDRIDLAQKLFAYENPVAAGVSEAAGSLVLPGAGAAGILGAGARTAARAAARSGISTGRRLARGSTLGAGSGALSGAGQGRDAESRLRGAGVGAVAGGLLGGAADVASPVVESAVRGVAGAARPVVRGIAEAVAPERATARMQRQAQEFVGDRLGDVGQRADEFAAMRRASPDVMAGDLDPTTRGIVSGLTAENTPATASMAENIMRRQTGDMMDPAVEGAGGRANRILAEELGSSRTGRELLEEIGQRQRTNAQADYAALDGVTPRMTGTLRGIMNTPIGARAWRNAQEIAGNDQRQLPQIFRVEVGRDGQERAVAEAVPDLRAWDDIKRGFDREIEKGTDAVTQRMNSDAYRAQRLKRSLLDSLDNLTATTRGRPQTSPYWQARNRYAGEEQLRRAYEAGTRFTQGGLRGPGEAEIAQVASSSIERSGTTQEAFRSGVLDALRVPLSKGGTSVSRFINNEATRRKLRALFPRGREGVQQFQALMTRLRAQAAMSATAQRLGNSETAGRTAMQQAMRESAGTPTGEAGVLRQILRNMSAGGADRRHRAFTDEAARLMQTQDPNVIRNLPQTAIPTTPGQTIVGPLGAVAAGSYGPMLGS